MGSSDGRPATISTDDIVRAGRALGMRDLSMSAAAAKLGVTAAALYRHVDGRWALERLVGEDLLGDLTLVDDPTQDLEQHLVGFGLQLYDFVMAHPGIGSYLQLLFPRGDAGRALLVAEVRAMTRRGHGTVEAIAVTNAMACVGIGLAVADERKIPHAAPEGFDAELESVVRDLLADDSIGPGRGALLTGDSRGFVALTLAATARGLAASAPPGRPIGEVITDLAQVAGQPCGRRP